MRLGTEGVGRSAANLTIIIITSTHTPKAAIALVFIESMEMSKHEAMTSGGSSS